MKPIEFFLYAAILVSTGCAQTSKPPFTEKRIVIARNETVKLKEIDLSITNHGCGRKWISKGNEPSYERAYCELDITYRNVKSSAGQDRDTLRIQDLLLKIERMNPWGREEDSVPAGGCRVWVKITKP